MPTLLQRKVEGIRLVVLGTRIPSDGEWMEHIEEALAWAPTTHGVLVISLTTGPTTQQRLALTKHAALKAQATAVVSSSAVARGIITAMSWLGVNVRAFAPETMDRAFDHLRVSAPHRAALLVEIDALQAAVDHGSAAN